MAPVSFAHPKTSEQERPMICSSGAPIMSANDPLAHTMRESSDCTQTPSSIASNIVSHVRSDAHSPAREYGKTGSDDSSFVVIFIGLVSLHPFEFPQSDFFRAIPLPAT
jgi:hypothetical protein